MRLKFAVDLHISKSQDAMVTEYDRGLTNAMAQKLDDRLIVSQRPSIDVFEKAADQVSDARGRGLFYWSFNTGLYIVNNDTVYKNSQSNDIGNITAGTERCYFDELAGNLILIDPQNDEGWVIDVGDNVTAISDTDFPPEQTPAIGLAHGVVTLDGTAYVLGEDGTIYGSDFEDLTSWAALNFVSAEREADGGTYIGKHHDNVVVMGPRTIEFFVDSANPTGSPLSRREDVFYSLGCNNGGSVWAEGDRLFFIGVDPSGQLSVYVLDQFSPRRVSNDTIDSYLTNAITRSGYSAVGAGYTVRGHTIYKLTLYTTPSDILPAITLAFDMATGLWSFESTAASDAGHFPLVAWTVRTGVVPRVGEGILSNGDLVTVRNNDEPLDTIGGLVYVEGDYVEAGYVEGSSDASQPITMTARLGMFDGVSGAFKFCPELRVIADRLESSNTVTIQWCDERTSVFSGGRTLDMNLDQKLTRLGRFRRRNFQLVTSSMQQLRLEALDIKLTPGLH